MTRSQLKEFWKAEEEKAQICGWDFSPIEGRYRQDDLPWDFRSVILRYLHSDQKILDVDTGGGEFLLSLNHPYSNTTATEGYPPNVLLCQKKLLPLGIDFCKAVVTEALPFADDSFDLILNRHGDWNPSEFFRVLKPGGLFLTQQVGAQNDRDLVELVLPSSKIPFPNQTLFLAMESLQAAGFQILERQEAFPAIHFFDTKAFIWFAKIISWEFSGFSVEACFDRLCEVHHLLKKNGKISGRTHRYLFVAQKPHR